MALFLSQKMPKSTLFDRSEVLDQVTGLFWKKGFHATSMQDLVDITGLNRSSIYNSFGDKFQLFEESLKHYQEMQLEMTNTSLNQGSTPLASIKAFFCTILKNIDRDHDKRGCLLSNCTAEMANADAKIKEFLVDNRDRLIAILKSHLQEAQKIGEIEPSKDIYVSAIYLFTCLHGLQITAMLYTDKKLLESVVERVLENI